MSAKAKVSNLRHAASLQVANFILPKTFLCRVLHYSQRHVESSENLQRETCAFPHIYLPAYYFGRVNLDAEVVSLPLNHIPLCRDTLDYRMHRDSSPGTLRTGHAQFRLHELICSAHKLPPSPQDIRVLYYVHSLTTNQGMSVSAYLIHSSKYGHPGSQWRPVRSWARTHFSHFPYLQPSPS
jgi:hypothetical protein